MMANLVFIHKSHGKNEEDNGYLHAALDRLQTNLAPRTRKVKNPQLRPRQS